MNVETIAHGKADSIEAATYAAESAMGLDPALQGLGRSRHKNAARFGIGLVVGVVLAKALKR